MKRLRHLSEYAAMRLLVFVLARIPYRLALGIGWFAAVVSFVIMRSRVREAHRRIRQVFGPQISSQRVRQIAWRSWRNFIFVIVESARTPFMNRNWLTKVSNGAEAMPKISRWTGSKGVILACPHIGGWELAGTAAPHFGIPLFTVAGKQRNPYVDKYLTEMRERAGVGVIMRGSAALIHVLEQLRGGRTFAILPDVRVHTSGVLVSFFGQPANVGTGLGLFAYHANVPVLPCVPLRVGWNRHEFHVGEPIWPDLSKTKKDACIELTQRVFVIIENAIREHPEQWFWFNRRWILEPLAPAESSAPAAPPA